MAIPENKFIKWIARRLADVTDKGIIDRLELWHVIEGEHGDKCDTFMVGSDTDPDEIAQEIWNVAEHDVSTRFSGQPNRYVVQAFRDSLDPECAYPFMMQGSQSRFALLGNESEAPTEKGALAQAMRQREDLHRLLVDLTQSQVRPLQLENQELRQQLKDAYATNLKVSVQAQELLDNSHQRSMEQAREEARERRHEQWMGMLMGTMPAVLSQLLGSKGGLPGGMKDSLTSRSLMELFRNMSEQEVVKVMSALEPQNQITVMQLYEASKAKYTEEQKQTPPLFRDKNAPTEEGEEEPVKH